MLLFFATKESRLCPPPSSRSLRITELSDHLVGTLKGVMLSKSIRNAKIVDIMHSVVPYDVLDGAIAIAAACKYFPARTVHVVVVDPGVGTARRPILVSADNQYFVAPDNGVLSMVYERGKIRWRCGTSLPNIIFCVR